MTVNMNNGKGVLRTIGFPYILLVLFTVLQMVQLCAQVPSTDRNYVLESVPREALRTLVDLKGKAVGQVNRSVQYFDGHGRPLQAIQWQGSPTRKDIVQHIEYDNLGRESKKYLPYTESLSADGSYKAAAAINQGNYYKSGIGWDPYVSKTPYPYAQTVFENSVLNRVKEQGAPGKAWQPAATRDSSGRTVVIDYGTNVLNDVRLWTINATGASGAVYYAAGTLSKTVSKDENWVNTNVAPNPPSKTRTVEEYRDLKDRTVLKRIWESETKKVETYYVYDNLGDLRYVIPPAVTATSFVAAAPDVNFENYIYAYKYDSRRRLIEKKIPGKGWDHLVYNKIDQVVQQQEAEFRRTNKWVITKYDAFGRIVMNGIHQGSNPRQVEQDHMTNNENVLWEERLPGQATYGNVSYPQDNFTVHLINYYDDYSFHDAGILPARDVIPSTKTKSLLTGTVVYRDDGTVPMLTVYYYDDKGRVIQTASQNRLGGTDYVTNSYSFVGELLSSTRSHTAAGKTTTLVARNEYDHVGRLVTTKHKVNAQAEVILARNEYNEIGQLRQKKQHSENGGTSYINTINYGYNERGWLHSSSSPYFSYGLNYNVTSAGALLGNAQYNSNIAQLQWGHGSTTMANTFTYGYDKRNRLIDGSSTGTVMKEAISYDDMGNVINLKRNGHATGTTYSYIGNKLKSLTGEIATRNDYMYDANGNMVMDHRLALYAYNYLNLPIAINNNGVAVGYRYDATGTRLQKSVQGNGIKTMRFYLDGIEYNVIDWTSNAVAIDLIHTSEGYLQNSGGTYSYHYNLTDHLGNVRATLQRTTATTGTVIQKHDYYAFGKSKPILVSGNNKYLYNGKEIQEELGGQYDYGARFYDAEIGRWNVADPLAENHYDSSPYAYALNNPSTYIDLLGLDTLNNNNNFKDGEWGKFNTDKDHIKLDEVSVNGYRNNWSWSQGWNDFSDFFSYPGLGWSFSGQSSGAYGPYIPTDREINSAGAVLSMIPATAPLGVVMQLSTAQSKAELGMVIATSLPYMRIVKGLGGAIAKEGGDIALGLGDDLFKFAENKGFQTYRDFSVGFQKENILKAIENGSNNLHFNLTGFSRFRFSRFNPSEILNHGNITNWELHTILNNPSALSRTTFYRFVDGVYNVVPNPF